MRTRVRRTLPAGIGFGMACAALFAAACTGVTTASQVEPGPPVELTLSGGLKPARLSGRKLAPVHFTAEGAIAMPDGRQPPPLRELALETDGSTLIDARGLPTCDLRRISGVTTMEALKACRRARIGEGTLEFEAFERPPLLPKSKLLAFNGGVKGGVTTILIHAFLKSPASEAIVITATVRKIHRGPWRARWVATIPPIADGNGSLTRFQLEIFREFAFKHEKQSYLLANCPNGKLRAHAEALFFGEASPLVTNFVLPCSRRA